MRALLLPDRAIVRVTGVDATHFLNNIVTNSVDKLTAGGAAFSALLTPQGKIIVDFFVVAASPEEDGGFVLDAPAALGPELVRRLGFYKLRAKVEVAPRPDLAVAVAMEKPLPEELGLTFSDPRHPGLGWRTILPAEGALQALEGAGMRIVGLDVWHGRRIALGIPEGGKDFIYGDTFPHEADMDVFHGVDFHKGCFIGQEVVSRVERQEAARKRVLPVSFDQYAPEEGAEIRAGDRPLGYMGSAAGRMGLAMLRIDRADEAIKAGEPLMAAGIEIRPWKPDWVDFAFPGDKEAAR